VKYAFIESHRRVWPISVQCRVLEVSISGYHEHFVRSASSAQRRHLSDDALLVHIKAIYAETRGAYGQRFLEAPFVLPEVAVHGCIDGGQGLHAAACV
jgi:hypothetical protein